MIQILNGSPKSVAVVFLLLDFDRIFDDPDVPFLFEVWAFPEDFSFKVGREMVLCHFHLNLTLDVYRIINIVYFLLVGAFPPALFGTGLAMTVFPSP